MDQKVLLKNFSYYKTGGVCSNSHFPSSTVELQKIIKSLYDSKTPYFILGAGSNSLVLDDDYKGDVLCMIHLNKATVWKEQIVCQAGITNREVTELAYRNGLKGLSWMHGLPGQIGGTVRMNARCYGGEISQIVTEVLVVTKDGALKTYKDPKKVFRGYKDTLIMDTGEIVAEVTISLSNGEKESIRQKMDQNYSDRKAKKQFDFPSCGCVFKNDYTVGISSGMLLEHAGVKKIKSTKVMVNPLHANFLFNLGNASSTDILEFTLLMREKVYEKFGVFLEYEMEILGNLTGDLKNKIYETRKSTLNQSALDPLRQKFKNRNS